MDCETGIKKRRTSRVKVMQCRSTRHRTSNSTDRLTAKRHQRRSKKLSIPPLHVRRVARVIAVDLVDDDDSSSKEEEEKESNDHISDVDKLLFASLTWTGIFEYNIYYLY